MTAAVGSGPSAATAVFVVGWCQRHQGREGGADSEEKRGRKRRGRGRRTSLLCQREAPRCYWPSSLPESSAMSVSAIVPARALCEFGIVIVDVDYHQHAG